MRHTSAMSSCSLPARTSASLTAPRVRSAPLTWRTSSWRSQARVTSRMVTWTAEGSAAVTREMATSARSRLPSSRRMRRTCTGGKSRWSSTAAWRSSTPW